MKEANYIEVAEESLIEQFDNIFKDSINTIKYYNWTNIFFSFMIKINLILI